MGEIGLLAAAVVSISFGAHQSVQVPVPPAIERSYVEQTRLRDGRPGPRYWQLRPQYRLRAQLVPGGRLEGSGFVSIENSSPTRVEAIVLRLDANRFRGSERAPSEGLVIRSATVDGEPVPVPEALDSLGTVVRLELPTPLLPDSSVVLGFDWSFDVPTMDGNASLRLGRWPNETTQVAQWYPRIAMLDDVLGWDVAPHEGFAEFYSPFADYDVEIEVPNGWIVGATGRLQNGQNVLADRVMERLELARRRDTTLVVVGPDDAPSATRASGGTTVVWEYRAEGVRDFAWAASPNYAWVVTSRTGERPLLVHALGDRHWYPLTRATEEAADVITRLSEWLGPYAADDHVLVDGPEGAMEYPFLTMSHGGVIGHELAHQWFPMQVGSDESRYSFLDEGVASFLAGVLSGDVPSGVPDPGLNEPLVVAGDLSSVRPVLGYGRGRRMLGALVEAHGLEAVVEALHRFTTAWRFRHPTPWDFMASMEASLGHDLDSFWARWLFSGEPVSGAVPSNSGVVPRSARVGGSAGRWDPSAPAPPSRAGGRAVESADGLRLRGLAAPQDSPTGSWTEAPRSGGSPTSIHDNVGIRPSFLR